MCLHNFIVDFREGEHCASESITLDWSVFDNDCRHCLATYLDQNIGELTDGGVHGGEQDIRRDDDFNQDRFGCPKAVNADSEVVGRQWRDNLRDEMSRRRLI
jgi:hypothetical protein